MGWTSYNAGYYKNGKVDRKAECDELYNGDIYSWDDRSKVVGKNTVLKSAMVGSTYYGAVRVQRFDKNIDKVVAVIILTSVDMNDYYNFAYKDMDESMLPYQRDCPRSILKLLTPTENENSLKWRELCYAEIEKKKNPNALKNLPVGSEIKVVMPFNTRLYQKGEEITLAKRQKWGSKRTLWCTTNNTVRFTNQLMKSLEKEAVYEIVKRGA